MHEREPITIIIATAKPTPKPAPTPTPTPTPSPVPSPFLSYATKSVSVFTLASDAPTATRITTEVVRQFTEKHVAHYRSIFVSQANWGLADYMRQCAYDPNTLGAVLVYPVVTQGAADNYLAGTRTWIKIDMFGMFLDCPGPLDAFTPLVSVTAVPFPGAFSGTAGRNNISILPLAGIISAVNSINNKSGTSTTTTSLTFPTPSPPPPPPAVPASPAPFIASQSLQQTTTKNSDIGVAAAATFLSVLGGSATIGQTDATGSHLTAIAAGRAVEPFAGSAVYFMDNVCGTSRPPMRPKRMQAPFYCLW